MGFRLPSTDRTVTTCGENAMSNAKSSGERQVSLLAVIVSYLALYSLFFVVGYFAFGNTFWTCLISSAVCPFVAVFAARAIQ